MASDVIPQEMLHLTRTARNFSFLLPFVEKVWVKIMNVENEYPVYYSYLDDQGRGPWYHYGENPRIWNKLFPQNPAQDWPRGTTLLLNRLLLLYAVYLDNSQQILFDMNAIQGKIIDFE